MSDLNVQISPMIQIDFSTLNQNPQVLCVKERGFLGYINLRGDIDNASFTSGIEAVLKCKLPVQANKFVEGEEVTVLWLGPNEWLLICPPGNETALFTQLKQALHGVVAALTDITGGNTLLEVSGEQATTLIEKGCPLDLHPSQFAPGDCAQSIIDKTGVTLYQPAPNRFHIIVRRSFADYLGAWLSCAAKEFV